MIIPKNHPQAFILIGHLIFSSNILAFMNDLCLQRKKNKLKHKKPFFEIIFTPLVLQEGNYFYSLVNESCLWKPNSLTSVLQLNFHSMKEVLINTANGESSASFPRTKSHLQLKLLQQQIL